MVVSSIPVAVTYTSDIVLVSSKEFLDIQATIESRFTLKVIRDMIITYSQDESTFTASSPKRNCEVGNIVLLKDKLEQT